MIAVDTNILVYSHRVDAPWHEIAASRVRELAEGQEPWAIAWPCLHEFLAIVTHPRIYNPPTPLDKALEQVEAWLSSPKLVLLTESEHHWRELKSGLRAGQVLGPKVHDARIAALCIQHGVTRLWTADRDFSRFPKLKTHNPLLGPKRPMPEVPSIETPLPDPAPTAIAEMAVEPSRPGGLRLQGLALFLFIPVVLALFTLHPRPIGLSLAAGVVLMLGHRFIARPYMERARPYKCLWCNGLLPTDGADLETVRLDTRGGAVDALCCPGHAEPAARYFTFLDAWRLPLAVGIFVPLLALLGTLAGAAAGWSAAPVATVTAVFKLVIGVTVNVAAFGYLTVQPRQPARVPFPVHNFYLLGVRILLWIFRLVGLWWIYVGATTLLTS